MMWNSYCSVGVAQIVLYTPVVLAAGTLLFRCQRGPLMPWIWLFAFSLGTDDIQYDDVSLILRSPSGQWDRPHSL